MIAFLRRIGVLRSRKAIQIATLPASEESGGIMNYGGVYALCDDGSFWFRRSGVAEWGRCLPVPTGWGA